MAKDIIKVDHIFKSIGQKTILEDISFSIASNQCVALIGPNGAGKTTLISTLLGDISISSGSLTIFNLPAHHNRLKYKVAILPQENVLPSKFTVRELIDFQRCLFPEVLPMSLILDYLQWSDTHLQQFTETLSGGQKRLLAFVLTLVGKPQLLFLDEPTSGMDTSTRQRFWELIATLKKEGVTIVYSSHYIEEVEHTADRILVLHKGKLLRDTTPFAMKQEKTEKLFTVPLSYQKLLPTYLITECEAKSDSITFVTGEAEAVWKILADNGCPIEAIEMTNRTLLNRIFETTKEVKHENL
ncbi:TPA: ABC transporter ATP-binding protein [Streptococcus agalactiae]